tara:strand:+ start:222 stop:515 length:294 start_codon:yes stop_codon:yes gene_type:complete
LQAGAGPADALPAHRFFGQHRQERKGAYSGKAQIGDIRPDRKAFVSTEGAIPKLNGAKIGRAVTSAGEKGTGDKALIWFLSCRAVSRQGPSVNWNAA